LSPVLRSFLLLLIKREYFVKAQYTGNEQLFGKTAIVTGANTGIGKEVVHDLARRGMTKDFERENY
jgi:hypothetical protein